MTILLSKSTLNDNYALWLKGLQPDILLKDAYGMADEPMDTIIQNCSAILLTGGADINPSRYGRSAEINRCDSIDDKRDALELELVCAAIKSKIPLLAICRGVQIINVHFNGTLVVDIPTDHGKKVEHRNKTDVSHNITVAKDSYLFQYGQALNYIVNSSHHQAIGKTGSGLMSAAWSDDDLIEAVQLKHEASQPFFLGVQWHPERMELSHPMSGGIGKAFLQKAAAFRS